jgi:outer membrane lipopolysaccharide assembly protein LptE/RlpB
MRFRLVIVVPLMFAFLVMQACTDSGFHLRNNISLPLKYQKVQIQGLRQGYDLVKVFQLKLEEAGGELLESASTIIKIHNYQEGRRVVAYTRERRAREYLLFLRFDYSVSLPAKNDKYIERDKRRINIDRTFIYDANFALGKAEEEKLIRQDLYEEASRLILLHLQYGKD